MIRQTRFLSLICGSLALLSTGCFSQDRDIAKLVTNHPELTPAVEAFNASQSRYKIKIAYSATPAKDLRDKIIQPDIIITEYLSSPEVFSTFIPLNKTLKEGAVDPESFIEPLISRGYDEEDIRILPLSFELPALMYKKSSGDHRFYLTLNELKTEGESFNKKRRNSDSFSNMSFAPQWDPRFLLKSIQMTGKGLIYNPVTIYRWSQADMDKSLKLLRDFSANINGSAEMEREFQTKYLYEPPYKTIAEERIEYFYTPSSDFFQIPSQKREDLDFSWIMIDGNVPVCQNIVYAGIPESASRTAPAKAFLIWLFQQENQEELIKTLTARAPGHFGIADGFSSLKSVSETVLPQYYPELVGRIPPVKVLKTQNPGPIASKKIEDEVLLPWLVEAVSSEPEKIPDLQNRLNRWALQNPNR